MREVIADVITHAKFFVNRFRGLGVLTPEILLSPYDWLVDLKIICSTNPIWHTAAILKKMINCYISGTVQPISMKFCMLPHIGPPNATKCSKIPFEKSKMADGRHFEKREMRYLCSRLSDFDKIWYGDAT